MTNYNTIKYPDARVLEAALKALERITGLTGNPGALEAYRAHAARRPHALVTLNYEHREYRYRAEVKNVDRVAALGLLKARVKEGDLPGLLVAPYITAVMAEHCRNMDIQFIDAAGNAYLKAEGLRIYVTGQKRRLEDIPHGTDRAVAATGLRVLFALLCKPALLNAPYRDIAKAAGAALGTVGWVFFALRKRGLLLGGVKKADRRLVNWNRLIDEWVLNYPARLRPKLWARRFRAPRADWWKSVKLDAYGALWGGEIAGDMLTDYRKPGGALVYLPGDPERFIIDNRLRDDPGGDVEILAKFWNFEDNTAEKRTAPPLLVYADLLAMPDPRNQELAKLVRERYLKNAAY